MKKPYWKFFFPIVFSFLIIPFENAVGSLSLDLGQGGSFTGKTIHLMMVIAVLSLAPALLMMATSFTRIMIVFSFLRNAIGLQQSPPNMVLSSLAMFLTFFVMGPTFEKAYHDGLEPLMAEKIEEKEAFKKIVDPFHRFMRNQVRSKDLELFMDLGQVPKLNNPSEIPLRVLLPSFMISEIRRAFEIGFLLFLPFLVIDLIVSSVLMSMGMMMVPPTMIALPFKVIFFVMIDGWHLLTGSLVKGFVPGG
jgi:flagellar biosynthetic protein FliP